MFPGLRLRLPTGEQVELELQTRPHPALRDRLLLNFSRMYISQLPPSSPPSLFKRCVCILLTNFKGLRAARFHSIFQFREAATRELIDDHMEIHILELPKVQSAVDEGEEPSLTRWCQFLAATTDLEREALGKRHPLLAEVKQALDELSRNPEARERAAQRAIELELEQS